MFLLAIIFMYKKLISNTLAQVFSKILTALIALVLISLLTTYLPIELFWVYNKVYNYLAIFAFLADLWLYTLIIREVASGKISPEKVLWNALTLRTVLGFVVVLWALWLATLIPGYNTPLIMWALVIIWLFTIVSLINSTLLAVMQARMQMEFYLVSFVWGKLLHLWLIAYVCLFLFSSESVLSLRFLFVFIAWLLSVIAMTFANYWYLSQKVRIRFLYDISYIKKLFFDSLPYGIALFLSVVYFKVDILLLSFFEPWELWDISIALYSVPMKIVEVLMVLGTFYMNSLLPSLTEMYDKKNFQKITQITSLSLKILISFWLFIYSMSQLFARDILTVLANESYISTGLSSLDVFPVVFAILWFHFVALFFIYLLIASHRQSLLLKVNIFVMLSNIFWNILFIPKYSFLWAAYTTLITQILLWCIVIYILRREISWPKTLLVQIFFTSIFVWWGVYIFWKYLLEFSWFLEMNDIMRIMIWWSCITAFYILWEWIISKKYIKNLL